MFFKDVYIKFPVSEPLNAFTQERGISLSCFTFESLNSYQVKEMEAKNALVRRRFQMHLLVQMTLQWLNQHKELPVTLAKPVYR